MSRIFLAAILSILIAVHPAKAFTAAPWNYQIGAANAYTDFIGNFWRGSATNGYIVTLTQNAFVTTTPITPPVPQTIAFAWEFGQGVNVLYTYWKETASSDALSRLVANWTFAKSFWSLSNFNVCGVSHGATANFAQDDTAWNAAWLLEEYEATGDVTALNWAKAALDCGYAEWYSTDLGGGMYYDDSFTVKSAYQSQFILDMLEYDRLAGTTTYLAQAEALDSWVAADLQRNGQTVGGKTYPNDGLYWIDITVSTGFPSGWNRPYQIAQTSSIVMLQADMAMAVVDYRLYVITGNPSYLTRVNSVALGIETYEIDNVTGTGKQIGCFLDDRDPGDAGFAGYRYAVEVIQNLNTTNKAAAIASLNTTAKYGYLVNRSDNGTYGGSWCGPNNNQDIWSTNNGAYSTNITVGASANIWPIIALTVQ